MILAVTLGVAALGALEPLALERILRAAPGRHLDIGRFTGTNAEKRELTRGGDIPEV